VTGAEKMRDEGATRARGKAVRAEAAGNLFREADKRRDVAETSAWFADRAKKNGF
jgi:hypothetical protein